MDQTTHQTTPGSNVQPDPSVADRTQEKTDTAQEQLRQSQQAASEAAEQVKRHGQQAAEELKAGAAELASEAKQASAEAAEQAKRRASQMADREKERLAGGIESVHRSIADAADRLRQEDKPELAAYVEMAAEKTERASSYLRERDLSRITSDVENLARRSPEIVLGGMVVAGLAVARFLKASGQRRRNDQASDNYQPNGELAQAGGRRYGADLSRTNLAGRTAYNRNQNMEMGNDYE